MKRAFFYSLVFTLIFIFGALPAAADSDNAARPVKYDSGCWWFYDSLEAEGGQHYLETKNGRWKLSCHGVIVEELSIHRAVHVRSTADEPVGECTTPSGVTADWHATFTPSGRSSFICHGDRTPQSERLYTDSYPAQDSESNGDHPSQNGHSPVVHPPKSDGEHPSHPGNELPRGQAKKGQ